MKIDAERLRGFLDCMHVEADARDQRSEAIRDIVKAAKEAGYDTKAVRKVFVRERMDEGERARQDDLLETYEAVLGPKGAALRAIQVGAKVGEAAQANGVHRATLARARHVAKQPSIATPHDADGVISPTGSAHEGDDSSSIRELEQPGWSTDPQIKSALPGAAGFPLDRDCGGSIGARAASEEVPQETPGLLDVSDSPERTAQISCPAVSACDEGKARGHTEPVPNPESDDLTIPQFLRAQKREAPDERAEVAT